MIKITFHNSFHDQWWAKFQCQSKFVVVVMYYIELHKNCHLVDSHFINSFLFWWFHFQRENHTLIMFSFSTWEVPWTFISKCFFLFPPSECTCYVFLCCSPPPGKNHGNVFLCCFAPAAAGKYIPFIFWHLCSGKANRVGLNRTSLLVSKKHKLRNVVKLVETSAKKQNTPPKNSTLWNVERVVWEGDRVLFESRNAIWGKTP